MRRLGRAVTVAAGSGWHQALAFGESASVDIVNRVALTGHLRVANRPW